MPYDKLRASLQFVVRRADASPPFGSSTALPMGYVDKNLISGEKVVYRASLTRLMYGWVLLPAALAIIAAVFHNYFPSSHRWLAAAILAGAAVCVWLWARIRVASAEFAVTDRRVIVKVGVLQRRTVETMLTKVEGVAVDQGLRGRIFDYGTVAITGTGGTREAFEDIAAPLEFRRQIQSQLARMDDDRAAATRASQGTPR
jgi:uncharacterized membrane protein YdbT with pleckstrin-like domain